MQDLDEPKEATDDQAIVRSAVINDNCEDRELLPPLLEPVMAGILEVLKSSQFRAVRHDAIWSFTRSAT